MQKYNFDRILAQIARTHHTSVAEVRREMEAAMQAALENPSPIVQSQLQKLPKQGCDLTLGEFAVYLVKQAGEASK